MSKKQKITVTVPEGTFTRTTDHIYTHLVIGSGRSVAYFEAEVKRMRDYLARATEHIATAERVDERGTAWKGTVGYDTGLPARLEQGLARAEEKLAQKRAGTYRGAYSWHSSERLAQTAASRYRAEGEQDIKVIPTGLQAPPPTPRLEDVNYNAKTGDKFKMKGRRAAELEVIDTTPGAVRARFPGGFEATFEYAALRRNGAYFTYKRP